MKTQTRALRVPCPDTAMTTTARKIPQMALLRMRVAIVIFAVGSILPSFFPIVVAEAGLWKAICLTICAAGAGAAVGPFFIRWWAGSLLWAFTAAVMTMLTGAGITFLIALGASILVAEEHVSALASAPMVFVSGALTAPLALFATPLSLIPWALGAALVRYCARRTISALEDGKEDAPPMSMSWRSQSH